MGLCVNTHDLLDDDLFHVRIMSLTSTKPVCRSFGNILWLAIKRIIENIGRFVSYWSMDGVNKDFR